MAIRFLTPKVTCSLITGGSACAGGGTLYWYQLPRNWKELFEKEGKVFLKEDDYKGMYVDQKSNGDWSNEDNLKDATESNVKDKAKSYCEQELRKPIPSENYDSTRKKLLSFCTIEGIVSVKGRLTHSGKNGWIDDTNGDDKYKTVFAVFKYNDKFTTWLKGSSSDTFTRNDKANDKYQKLKTKCQSELTKPYKQAQKEDLTHAYWYCTSLGYETVQERINKVDNDWQQETTGDTIKTKWENTEDVKNKVKSDQGLSAEPTGSDYKNWCDTQVSKKLYEDDIYQDTYLKVRFVCKKDNP